MSYEEALKRARENPDRDDEGVFTLLKKAARRGDLRAKYALATWYLNGTPLVERNVELGVKILQSLRYSNVAEAICELAYAFDTGTGCKKNPKAAFTLYFKAALLGDSVACEQMSEYFRVGECVERNMELSRLWKERSTLPEDDISPTFRIRL